jgi:antitoxin MazE
MRVSKWGNSLAVRLPVDVVETLSLKDGDEVDFRVDMDNTLSLAVVKKLSRAELHEKLKSFEGMVPADFVFNRDEANER